MQSNLFKEEIILYLLKIYNNKKKKSSVIDYQKPCYSIIILYQQKSLEKIYDALLLSLSIN